MNTELKSALEEMGEAFVDFRQKHEDRLGEHTREIEALNKAYGRPGFGQSIGGDPEQLKSQLAEYAKSGNRGSLLSKEFNTVDGGSTGGYVQVSDLESQIRSRMEEISPIWRASEKVVTSSKTYLRNYTDDGSVAVRAAEKSARTETTHPSIAQTQVDLSVAYHLTKLSEEVMQTSVMDLGRYVLEDNAIAFGELYESEAIAAIESASTSVDADGVRNFGLIQKVVTGSVGAVGYDDVIALIHSLAPSYRRSARLYASTDAIQKLRLLKDADGMPLWRNADLTAGRAPSLLGYEVVEAPLMPAVSNGAIPVYFGDISRAHLWASHQDGYAMLRDELTQKGYVQLYNRIFGLPTVPMTRPGLKMRLLQRPRD
ncbi:phage major capsid protein [Congregibacter variabilis]|uniref:Phage major capsid protein n=1 Tax=Congregibacter variabilis TaxID=3081200 RepID=A0ABZ0I3W1_9GAMM|nr:phage major capsid protein [Congregibacter sp. IMCC43200]